MIVYSDSLFRGVCMALLVVVMLVTVIAMDPLGLNSPVGLATPVSAQGGTDLSGQWQSSERSNITLEGYPYLVMYLDQSGGQVTGDYHKNLGYDIIGGKVNGNLFTGMWQGGTDSNFELTIAPDGQSMSGRYIAVGSVDHKPKGDWTSITFTRKGAGTGTTTGMGAALTAESRTADPNSTVQVPIRLDRAASIGSMNFILTYNAQVLKVNKVDSGSLVGGALFTPNFKTPPQVRFGLAGSDGINGSGPVAYIEFQVIGAAGTSSPLTLSEVDTTDTSGKAVTVTTANGTVTVASATGSGNIPDVDGDGKVTELDALAALKMSVKLLEEKLKLDVDKNGKVTAEDARLILKMAVGK